MQTVLGVGVSFLDTEAGDLNLDGRADLVGSTAGGVAYVLLAAEDGSFPTAVLVPDGGLSQVKVVIAEFNGDGTPDLAVGDGAAGGRVGIMLGLGDGTFENWGDTSSRPAKRDSAARFLRLRRRRHSWICSRRAVTGQPTVPNVKLLRGLGDGTFASGVDYATVCGCAVAAADGPEPRRQAGHRAQLLARRHTDLRPDGRGGKLRGAHGGAEPGRTQRDCGAHRVGDAGGCNRHDHVLRRRRRFSGRPRSPEGRRR